MSSRGPITDAEILDRIVGPLNGRLPPDAARFLLSLRFDGSATRQIRRLLVKNNRGTISAQQRTVLDRYLRVGQFLDLVHAKARLSLQE